MPGGAFRLYKRASNSRPKVGFISQVGCEAATDHRQNRLAFYFTPIFVFRKEKSAENDATLFLLVSQLVPLTATP
jgi:hypothetical protein